MGGGILPKFPCRVETHFNFYSFPKKVGWTWSSFMQMNGVNDPIVPLVQASHHFSPINLQPKQNYCHKRGGSKRVYDNLKRDSWEYICPQKNTRGLLKLMGRNHLVLQKACVICTFGFFLAQELGKWVSFLHSLGQASLPVLSDCPFWKSEDFQIFSQQLVGHWWPRGLCVGTVAASHTSSAHWTLALIP